MAPAAQLVAEYRAKFQDLYDNPPTIAFTEGGHDFTFTYVTKGWHDEEWGWDYRVPQGGRDAADKWVDAVHEGAITNKPRVFLDNDDADYPDQLRAAAKAMAAANG